MSKLGAGALAAGASLMTWAAPAVAQTVPPEPDRYAYWPHMIGWEGGWYGGGPIMMIVWFGIAVALIVLLIRAFARPGRETVVHQRLAGRTALDILKERFARGEIDKAEFEDKRRTLGE